MITKRASQANDSLPVEARGFVAMPDAAYKATKTVRISAISLA